MSLPIRKSISLVLSLGGLALAQQRMPAEYTRPEARALTQAQQYNYDMPPPNLGELMQANNGSLYRAAASMPADPRLIRASDVSFFTVPVPKPRTMQKHDLLTIIVREESEFSSDATTDTKKDAGIDATVDQIPSINLSDFVFKPGIGDVKPELKLSGNRTYKGEGSVDRKDSLTARIQAEVVDVKPNGTLVLQARKRIVTDEEQQLLVLTGICRVQDITADNTILSTQMFDLDVRKTHTGAVRDATKRGWIPRALDWINPF